MAKITKVELARRARLKSGTAKIGDEHTSAWWSKRYREIKKYATRKGISLPYGSRKDFIVDYVSARQAGETRVFESLKKNIRKTVPDVHSVSFFGSQYEKMRRYAESKGLDFPWKSRREFISDYRATKASGAKRPLDEMRYFLKHKTAYKVARSEYRKAREFWQERKKKYDDYMARAEEIDEAMESLEAGEVLDQDYIDSLPAKVEDPGQMPKFTDFQDMTTTEFAERYSDELREAYHAQREAGMTSKQAKAWVSTNWFASP